MQIGRGHYETAISNFEDAIGLSISAGQERRAADFAMEHGELLGQLGRQSQALERFEWACSLYRGNEAVRAVAKADDRAAACLIDLGRLDDALGLLRNVLAVAEMTNDTAFQTHARYRLGWTLQLADNYEEALEYLSKARDGYDDLDDILGAAKCDQVAASVLGQINREDEALDLFRRCPCCLRRSRGRPLRDRGRGKHVGHSQGSREENAACVELCRTAYARAMALVDSYLIRSLASRFAEALLRLDEPNEAARVIAETEEHLDDTDEVNETSLFAIAKARDDARTR